jgi:hypothetical protein
MNLSGRGFPEIMVSQCANPKCRVVFRYLQPGKPFEFEVRTLGEPFGEGPGPEHQERLKRDIGCFRLCASCALTMMPIRESHTDQVVLVPFHSGVERRGDTGDAAPANPGEQGWQ